jgi:hypothetical protein
LHLPCPGDYGRGWSYTLPLYHPPLLKLYFYLECFITTFMLISFSRHRISHRVGRVLSFFPIRRNCDSPTPLGAGECASPPFGPGGEGYTRLRERGWGSPNSDEGTYTVVLYIQVICGTHCNENPTYVFLSGNSAASAPISTFMCL